MTHTPPLTANAAPAAALLAGQPLAPEVAACGFAGLLLALGLPALAAPKAGLPVATVLDAAEATDKTTVKRPAAVHGSVVAKPLPAAAELVSAAPAQPAVLLAAVVLPPVVLAAAPPVAGAAPEVSAAASGLPRRMMAQDVAQVIQARLPAIAPLAAEPAGTKAAAAPAALEPAVAGPPSVGTLRAAAAPAGAATVGAAAGAATAGAATADHGSAARQVAPVLVQVAQAAGGSAVTLRLDPAELGHLEIRIERGADGSSVVHVAVERPETLRALLADQGELHRALDSAGLTPESRSLTVSLSPPGDRAASSPAGLSPSSGDYSGGAQSSGGQAGGDQAGGGQAGGGFYRPGSSAAPGAEPDGIVTSFTAAWHRAGVDITA